MNKPKLDMIALFSGIGAQETGFINSNLFDVNVVATADLDKEVNCMYSAIFHGMNNDMINNYDYPSKEEMIKELTEKRIGYDFQKDIPCDWNKLAKKKDKTKGIERYWLAVHLSNNLGDVTQIKHLPECDLLFYSSPCTDYSQAGRQEGGKWTCLECGEEYNPLDFEVKDRYTCPICGGTNIKSTRSGCLFEVERLLVDYKERDCLPKYLMLENVKALTSKKFIDDFNAWNERLDNLGYNTRWKIINGKDCEIPQNRERVFAISIRKDIDTGKFTFPKPIPLKLRLKDILQDNVAEEYYINTDKANELIRKLIEEGKLPEKEYL